MLVLDTDHFVEYEKGTSAKARELKARIERSGEPLATTIVTIEEVMRGWLAAIHGTSDLFQQIRAYDRLQETFRVVAGWTVLSWNEAAVQKFDGLRKKRVRIGTFDLKIASVTLTNQATLLTRNTVDFAKVPGLRFEDWLS